MIDQTQILNYLSSNKQDISQKYNLTKLGIFGSFARNEQTTASDLDLIVEFENNTVTNLFPERRHG
jgi:predicted nucleotidyltransferase